MLLIACGDFLVSLMLTFGLSGSVASGQQQDEAFARFSAGAEAYKRGQYSEALLEWRYCGQLGIPRCRTLVGTMLYLGDGGIMRDWPQARKWFQLAAEQGDRDAQAMVGSMYLSGEGGAQDSVAGASWIQKAAVAGHVEAQRVLGLVLYHGDGVKRDSAQAAFWFAKAAEQGSLGGQLLIGLAYLQGDGVRKDDHEAVKWLRKAADRDLPIAQVTLAAVLGDLNEIDEAARWWRRAAEHFSVAQYHLGLCYEYGRGVPADITEAVVWYRRAAEQGDVQAQFRLGYTLYIGKGIAHDYPTAARWLREAADKGVAPAQAALAVMYSRGEGIPQDHVLAYMWANLAAATMPDLAASRDVYAKLLSREQLANAQEMSRDWVPKPQRVQEPDVRGAEAEPRLQPKPSSTGTGFLVSQDGNVITNRHVVSGCSTLVAVNTNHREPLSVVAIDRNADLALLKMGFSSPAFASIGNTPSVRPGESVTVVGFPLWGILGSDAVISVGNVSSLTGPGDDRQLLQITAPIQPGSSGSPVLASNGEVVGVVVGKLHLKTVPEAVVPENVNFAIKAAAVCSFLQANGIRCSTGSAAQKLDSASVAERARGFTVAVECWK